MSLTRNVLRMVDGQLAQVTEHIEEAEATEIRGEWLNNARSGKKDRITAAYRRSTNATFKHRGKDIECDKDSRDDLYEIALYVLMNDRFPAWFTGEWKCADNSYLNISNVNALKQIFSAMVEQTGELFTRMQGSKARIDSLQTIEEIQEFDDG